MGEELDKNILTTKIIEQITPRHIIYAEVSEQGAMGEPGNAMVYLQSGDNDVIFCQASVFEDDQREAYEKFCKQIAQYVAAGEILETYGGFGNHCYKGERVRLTRDDDKTAFIFELNGKKHILKCSCRGVYSLAAAKFAQRLIDFDRLVALLKNSKDELGLEEIHFMLAYVKRRKDYDQGQTYMDKDAMCWASAMDLIQMKNQKVAFLTREMIDDGVCNTQYYKLEYVIKKIGWNKINDIMCEIVEKSQRKGKIQSGTVAAAFAGAFGNEGFYGCFSELKIEPAEICDIRDLGFCDQFQNLSILKFTKKQHDKIINDIRGMSVADLRASANSVAHYFANYSLQDDSLSYAELFPALIRVLNDLPNDDLNHTRTDATFFVTGFILTKILRMAPRTHLDYIKNEYFKVFWHRTGGLEIIKHFQEFEFKNKAQEKMFKHAINFLANLDNIQDENKKYYDYLCASGKKVYEESNSNHPISLRQYMQALAIYIRDIASKNDHHNSKQNAAIQRGLYLHAFVREIDKSKEGKQGHFNWFFATMCEYYPKDRNKMKILFKEIVTLDFALSAIVEYILLDTNPKIITYALECIVDNMEAFYEADVQKDSSATKFFNMYMCACEVVSSEDHLEKLAEIKEFILERGERDKNIINCAYRIAKNNVKKAIFQREELAKMQKYGFVSFDELSEG